MKVKKLKFLIGGLVIAVFATVVVFAAGPTHAQMDDNSRSGAELTTTELGNCMELSTKTEDCSQTCSKEMECEAICVPNCQTGPCEKN